MNFWSKMRGYAYIQKYALYSLFIFLFAVWFGYYTATIETVEVQKIFEQLSSELSSLEAMGSVTLFLIIFFNNSIKAFAAIFLGVFFGIIPAFFLFANGYILGIVSYLVIQDWGIGATLWGTLPHGIIEIPTLILSSAYGLWLGSHYTRKLRYGEPIREYISRALRVYLHIFIPLFFLAALIEVFVTNNILTLIVR